MGNFQPKEVLYNRNQRRDFSQTFGGKYCIFELDDWVFTEQTARQKLLHQFKTRNLKGFGVEHLKNGLVAAGAIMQYLEITQHTNVAHISSISRIEEERFVRLDSFTIRSLELVNSMNEGGKSLLSVIDKTITPMGSRLLRRWVVFPLKDKRKIDARLDVVDSFFRQPDISEVVEESLHSVGDMERMISKAAVGRISPRDVVLLKNALVALRDVKTACMQSENDTLKNMGERLELCDELCERIEKEMVAEPPLLLNRGNVIRPGYDSQLDELRDISQGGRDYLLNMQKREMEQTGISSLKVGYNNVFGYYLEVRNTFKDKVPQEWVRKQTLAQAERYITQELKEYEEKILGADEKIQSLEEKLFNELVQEIQKYIVPIQQDALVVAQIDCLLSFANVAKEHRYMRPQIDDSYVLDIKQGRHPVIETQLAVGDSYVPNDVYLDNEKQQIMIITGPNMAGKSALLRQTALIVLLAQIGCYVPADSARVGIVDKIFTRVGASDNISLGESTFMVEMTEAANILNNVSERSLVLFDELGRGTSTYDGISIAWAIVEYLHDTKNAQARTLFATHYHELNEMENKFDRIKNYNVSVRDIDGQIIFLRKLVRGGSAHSFGIHVAEISGMPKSVVRRANVVLKQLEAPSREAASAADSQHADDITEKVSHLNGAGDGMQLSFFQLDDPVLSQIRDEIIGLDINNLTPMEALNKLNDIKKIVVG